MKRFLFAVLLLGFLPFSASAQREDSFWKYFNDFLDLRADKAYAKLDSNYIGRYSYHWNARLFLNTSGLHLVTEGPGYVRLSTGMSNRVPRRHLLSLGHPMVGGPEQHRQPDGLEHQFPPWQGRI